MLRNDYNEKTIEEFAPNEYNTLFTKDESSLLKEYLRKVYKAKLDLTPDSLSISFSDFKNKSKLK